MKFSHLSLAIAFVASGLVACASDSQVQVSDPDAGGGTGPDDSGSQQTPQDSGSSGNKPDSSGAKDAGKCVNHCTTDSDCQNSCPSVASGINCCDTATSTCYPASTATCPVPQPDSGNPTPY